LPEIEFHNDGDIAEAGEIEELFRNAFGWLWPPGGANRFCRSRPLAAASVRAAFESVAFPALEILLRGAQLNSANNSSTSARCNEDLMNVVSWSVAGPPLARRHSWPSDNPAGGMGDK